MKKGFWWTVAVVVLLAGWYLWPRSWPITNLPPTSGNIVLFGDSLAFGTGSSQGNDPATLIGGAFGRRVINLGVPGDATKDGIARLDLVVSQKPGLVLVCLGGNDALQRVRTADLEANLREIVGRLQGAGAVVCLLAVDPPTAIGLGYGKIFRRVARTTGCVLVEDILGGIIDSPRLKADPLHPNNEGYKVMTRKIIDEITPVVERLP